MTEINNIHDTFFRETMSHQGGQGGTGRKNEFFGPQALSTLSHGEKNLKRISTMENMEIHGEKRYFWAAGPLHALHGEINPKRISTMEAMEDHGEKMFFSGPQAPSTLSTLSTVKNI